MNVNYPNFVIKDGNEIERLLCKGCGATVASTQSVKDGVRIEPNGVKVELRRTKFVRHATYAEIKMQMTDGSYHVSLGCRTCLSMNLTPEELLAIYQADMEEQRPDLGDAATDKLLQRVPDKVLLIKLGGGVV